MAPMVAGAERRADADEWVYLTTDRNGAWLYAYDSGEEGEPTVYSVLPLDDVERDREHSPQMPAYRCRSVVVLSIDRDAPFSEEQARAKWIPEH